MAAMKLYYGSDLVGGDVDLAEFEQLKTDVEGKYDKGDPSILEGDVMQYGNAALMEQAVLGNAGDIAKLREDIMESLIPALEEGGENIEAEFTKYFPIYGEDDAVALAYDNAADLGLAVSKNIQDISDEVGAREEGDKETLKSANEYTDDKISKIPGVDGIEEVEKNAVRNQNLVDGADAPVGVMSIAVVDELPDFPSATTLYVVTG